MNITGDRSICRLLNISQNKAAAVGGTGRTLTEGAVAILKKMTPRTISYSCNPALKNRRVSVSDLAQRYRVENDASMTVHTT